MYLTSGENVSTSRLRICWSPVFLYLVQSASVSSWEMRRRLPVSGFIAGGTPWGRATSGGRWSFRPTRFKPLAGLLRPAGSQALTAAADDQDDPFQEALPWHYACP